MSRVKFSSAHGSTLVEYALLVLLVIIPLLFGIIEFSILFSAQSTIANAAREGARYGITDPGNAPAIEARVREKAVSLDGARLEVASSLQGAFVRVDVAYNAHLVTGAIIEMFGGSSTIRLHSSSMMQIE
ncbi:MAG: pilus assembly protein [Chloroflexi bacterium]|nr:pilus assembly protein [Chloroflexota bacterium]